MALDLTSLLSRDDWIYTAILVISFVFAFTIRTMQKSMLFGGLIGVLMTLTILGWKIVFSAFLVTTVCILHQLIPPKRLPLVVFVWTFVYLMFLRHLHQFVDVAELASHANVVQLIVTLRVIGLTFEITDAKTKKSDGGPKRYLTEEPCLLEKLAYLYHFCGLFTGPYYTFQMLKDASNPVLHTWSPIGEVTWRIQRLAWSVPLFVLTNKMFPLDGLRSDAVWEMSLFWRFVYGAAVFTVFRFRVYSAWAIAESICVVLGIGVYPAESKPKIVVGPTDIAKYNELKDKEDVEMSSEAIVNLDIKNVEISDSFREGIRSWNRSVQTWLALFVHSRASKLYRVELTMFVSALWHGTYAGYFMSFLLVPMCTAVEGIIFKMVPVDAEGKRPEWFRWIYIFTFRSRGFDMMATGFLLKNFADTHRFWLSIYYWLPLVTLPLYVLHKFSATEKHSKKN